MNIETFREYCLTKVNVAESFPFGDDTLVFKVGNKIFALVSLTAIPMQFNVKCAPEEAISLREEFPDAILPGYHMNKKHWNTVIPGTLKNNLVKKMIDDSYSLVSKKKMIS